MTIYCVGRNYLGHTKELGNKAPDSKKSPLVFLKPGSAASPSGQDVQIPGWSSNVHFETEMALEVGADLKPSKVAIALDLTARDVQKDLASRGEPWALAKGFKQSAPIGSWSPVSGIDLQGLQIQLLQNGQLKQNGFTKDMMFGSKEIFAFLAEKFPLQAGDIVLTGSPPGVGPTVAQDVLEARLLEPATGKVLSQGIWRIV